MRNHEPSQLRGGRKRRCVRRDIVARKPASAAPVQLAVPPAAGVAVEDADDLASAEAEAVRVRLLRSEVVHGEYELARVGILVLGARIDGRPCT